MTTCVECGHSISERAKVCPKCKWQCVKCFLCEAPIKKSDFCEGPWADGTTQRIYHRDCLHIHFQIPPSVVCPDCGASLADMRLNFKVFATSSPCTNCGFPNPFQKQVSCRSCGREILESFQKKRKGWRRRRDVSDFYEYEYFHDFCHAKEKGWHASDPNGLPPVTPQAASQSSSSSGCLGVLAGFLVVCSCIFWLMLM
jgi:hypothetical protein